MSTKWVEVGEVPVDDKWKEVGTVSVSAAPSEDNFYVTPSGAAFGRPRRGQAVIQETKPFESFGAGVAKSVVDPFVGTAQFVSGGNWGKDIAQRLGQEAEYYAEKDPMWYGTGRVGGALIPGVAAAKGTSAIGAIPSFIEKTKKAAPYIQSSVLGALSGLVTPEETGKTDLDYYKGQGVNALIGGVAAPILTGGGQALGYANKLAKRLIEPFTDLGKEKVVGRALIEGAGGEADRAIANLESFKPHLKGVEPTMAEAAKVPSLAALERSAISNNPEVGNIIARRDEARNLLRKDYIQNLAGVNGEKVALEKTRQSVADDNYRKAFKQKAEFKEVPTELLELKNELLNSKAIQKAVVQAKETLSDFGAKNINPTQSIQGLHEVKLALDDQIAKLTKPDLSQNEARKIAGITAAKDRLVNFLENDSISPAYKKAREVYAAMSKPINELETIGKIADKVVNPNSDAIYSTQLARQLKNLEKSGEVSAGKMESLKALQKDIQGQEYAQRVGKPTGSDTAQKLAYSNLTNQMGVPNWLQGSIGQATSSALGQAGNMLFSNANKELASKLAQVITDPKEAARLMKLAKEINANPSKISEANKRLIELLGAEGAIQFNPFSSSKE